ncbi:MAG: type II secretion system F family protein [Anaerolineae bacterium]|nr:type II secretion system F family protein [Anaerolineae bacterium]
MMTDTTAFDRQLGDVVGLMTHALRAGYSMQQIFEKLSTLDVEPTVSIFKTLVTDLQTGSTLDETFAHVQETWPSPYLARVIAVIQQQHQLGGNLALMLDPVGEEILAEVGTDKALYSEMREMVRQLGGTVPERLLDSPV